MKPTVIHIGDDDDEKKKPLAPTVIRSAPPAPAVEVKLEPPKIEPEPVPKPTVMHMPETVSPPPPVHKTAIVPTFVPGVKPKTVSVTIEELRSQNAKTDEDILRRSLQIVSSVNPDNLTDTTLVLWGQDCQVRYNQLVDKCLAYSASTILTNATKHVSRLQEIIGGIHLKELLGLETRSLKDRLFGSREEPMVGFERTRTEMGQLIKLMQLDLPNLLKFKQDLEALSRQIDQLGNEVEANAIAALFLADYILRGASDRERQNLEAHAQLLTGRSMSLTQTLAQIRGSNLTRDMQIKRPLELITVVQNVALVQVSAWLGSYSSLKSLLESRQKPTPTEVDELARVQTEIFEQLKKG